MHIYFYKKKVYDTEEMITSTLKVYLLKYTENLNEYRIFKKKMQRSVNLLFLHFQELHIILVSNLLQNYVKSTRMPGKQSAFFQKIFYSMQFLRQPSLPPYKESFHSNNLLLQRLG